MNQLETKIKSLLVEFIPFGLLVTDDKYNIVFINEAFKSITGWGEEIIGQNPRVLKSGDMSNEYYQKLYHTLSEGGIWHEKVKNKRKDDSYYWALQKISPIYDNKEKVLGYIAIQEEITQLIETEEKLERALKSKDLFLSSVNHELKSPISSVFSLARFLQNTNLDDEQRDYVDKIVDISSLGINLVENISDVIRGVSNEIFIKKREINLKNVVDRFDKKLVFNNENPNIEYIFINKLEDKEYYVDDKKISQIIYNIVGNAFKYTTSGFVRFQVWEDDKIYFEVEDTGSGISKENLENIFNAFFQEKRDNNSPGLGLGLYISKQIAKKMGGDIVVESSLGKGSKFILFLEK